MHRPEINVHPSSMNISDDYNYKRLIEAMREGSGYENVVLLSRYLPEERKRKVNLRFRRADA